MHHETNTYLEGFFERIVDDNTAAATNNDNEPVAPAMAVDAAAALPPQRPVMLAPLSLFSHGIGVVGRPSSFVVPAPSAPPANQKKDLASAPFTPANAIAVSAARHYTAQNPHFETAQEPHIVPVVGPPRHFGDERDPKKNERIIQVARYGHVYKRKAPCAFGGWKTPPGTRFCRMCNKAMPLDAFYTHIKRFVCRRHHAERVGDAVARRCTHDPSGVVATEMWSALTASRDVLGYDHVNYDIKDIHALVLHSGLPFGMRLRAIPIDPGQPMRPRNIAIVSLTTFTLVLRTYAHMCSRALFIAQVQRSNLIPPTLDVGWPEFPMHDPSYRRQDIDVGPMLLAELQGPLDCADRTQIEALLQAEPAAPWTTDGTPRVAQELAMRDRWKRRHHPRKLKHAAAAAAAEEEAAAAAAAVDEEEADEASLPSPV